MPLLTLIAPLERTVLRHVISSSALSLNQPRSGIRSAFWFFPIAVLALLILVPVRNAAADELILDESLTDIRFMGDFEVATVISPVELSEEGLFDDLGEITTGQLYSFFKKRGLKSVQELKLCVDFDPSIVRADYSLSSIQVTIDDVNSVDGSQVFRLGDDNILKVPSYEASKFKPEASITIKLDYDFMEHFNENSTEKLRFDYLVDGERAELPVRIGVVTDQSNSSFSRLIFLTAFSLFWVFVFLILFRMTSPKSQDLVSAT